MSGWRKIVVDGVAYRWKFGLGTTCVRLNDKSFAKYDTAQLLGLSNDAHERAIWKRTLNGTVTPRLVAKAIRETRNGLRPGL